MEVSELSLKTFLLFLMNYHSTETNHITECMRHVVIFNKIKCLIQTLSSNLVDLQQNQNKSL